MPFNPKRIKAFCPMNEKSLNENKTEAKLIIKTIPDIEDITNGTA